MRLLFVSNFYPPASRGGFEGWCQEVAEGLRNRGHDVAVLTSLHGREEALEADPSWVHRQLNLEMELASLRNGIDFFTRRGGRERQNLALLRRLLEEWAPDGLLMWGMWNLPRSLPALAEALRPDRTAYYFGDYWPTLPDQFSNYWAAPAQSGLAAIPKSILGAAARQILSRETRPALQLKRAMFPSEFMRAEYARQGIEPEESRIVLGGVETAPYLAAADAPVSAGSDDELTLLFAGRLVADKGVATAVEAVAHLVHRHQLTNIKLLIAGSGDADYVRQLEQLIARENLAARIQFVGTRSKDEMPALYRQADVFLFTSLWDEPFGRVIVEAMASGRVVIGTGTGGAGEILADGVNGLIYPAGDSAALADQIIKLVENRALREQLAAAGRRTAVEKYDICHMVSGVEDFLKVMVG